MPLPPLRTQVTANTTGFVGGMNRAIASLGGFKGGLAAATGALAVLAGAKGLAGATRAFARFDAKMTESQAIMDDLSEDTMAEMEQAALDVSRTTLKSADEAAESYFFLASAGLDAEQSIAALPQVAKFAQAGMFDMATATDLATDAQSALGLVVEDAQQNLRNMTRVTDVLVRANQQANATVEQFSESLTNKLGPRLRILGKDIEEGVAGLATLADQGIKGRKAGRGLSIVYRDLAREAVRSAGAFEELGIQVFDNNGEMRNLADIVEDFEEQLAGASDRTKTARLQMLGINRRAIGFLNSLIGMSDELREYEKNLRSAGGATQEVAEKQIQTLNRQMDLLGDEVEAAKISLGGFVAPGLEKDARALRVIIREIREGFERAGEESETAGEKASRFWLQGMTRGTPMLSALVEAREGWEKIRDAILEAEEAAREAEGPVTMGGLRGGRGTGGAFGPEALLPEDFTPPGQAGGLSDREQQLQQLRERRARTERMLADAVEEARLQETASTVELLNARREELRLLTEKGAELEKIRTKLQEVARLQVEAEQQIQEEIRKGIVARRERTRRQAEEGVPSLPREERGVRRFVQTEVVEGSEPVDLNEIVPPPDAFEDVEQALKEGMLPALDQLGGKLIDSSSMLGTFLDTFLTGLSEFLSGKGGTEGFLGDLAGAFAGGFQHGGRIGAGEVGLVGEDGVEAITGPARVTSNRDLARALRSGQPRSRRGDRIEVNVTNNLQAVDTRGIERLVKSDQFRRGTVEAVVEAAGRNKGVSRAIIAGEGG